MRFLSRRALLMLPVFVVAVVVAALPTVSLGDESEDFHAKLDGYHEVIPAGGAVNTKGFAVLKTRLNDATNTIMFRLEFSGLSSTLIQAHYHFGQRFTTGGVMVFLCGPVGSPAKIQPCPTGPAGVISGTLTAADVIGPTGQGIPVGDMPAVLAAIRNDASYANMHTSNFPAGEIRGQIED